MFYRAISIAFVTVLLQGSIAAQDQPPSAPPQTADKMQQILHKAQEKDKTVKVTLNRKIGKHKFSGKVNEISDEGFTLTDQKAATATKFAYKDVQEVRQRGMSKGWIIALVVGAGVVVAAVIVGETITGGD